MGCKRMPQSIRRHALLETGHVGGGVASASELTRRYRVGWVLAREQPSLRSRDAIPVAQKFKQRRGKHRVTILATFALFDAQHLRSSRQRHQCRLGEALRTPHLPASEFIAFWRRAIKVRRRRLIVIKESIEFADAAAQRGFRKVHAEKQLRPFLRHLRGLFCLFANVTRFPTLRVPGLKR
jgi:hypothetical protein